MTNKKKNEEFAVELDLTTASNAAFMETVAAFYEWSATQSSVDELDVETGWITVDPLPTAQDWLRRNLTNRHASLATVRKYYYDMARNDWRRTGQTIAFNQSGKLNDGQNRLWACYLGKVSFTTLVVTDVPDEPDLFAYYDDVKARTAADALQTSGVDGIASHIAGAAKLHYRWQLGAITPFKQPKIRALNNREILAYHRSHPSLGETAHMIIATYPKAVSIIDSKPVAIVFAEKVLEVFDQQWLDQFMEPLGSGANLQEGDPILGLRHRLLGNDLNKERRLALLIKAFNYRRLGKKLSKSGLSVRDNEKFPTLQPESQEVESD